jgi:hypothetical protein
MGNNGTKISVDRRVTPIEQAIFILQQIKKFNLDERETINVNGEILTEILQAYYEQSFCHEDILYPISASKRIK